MLPCSVRRVAATAPQTPILSNFGSSVPRTVATAVALSHRQNQNRRYSSSKPSRDNGSEGLPVGRPADAKANSESKSKASSGDKRKRKANRDNEVQKQKYPSVPSTSHISPDFLALSSFFSLHRPVSITRGLPKNVTEDYFASIFATPASGAKPSEVISTLSQTVADLERPGAKVRVPRDPARDGGNHTHVEFTVSAEDAAMYEEAVKAEEAVQAGLKDGNITATMTMDVNAMSGQFLPFRPPPVPVPESEVSPTLKDNAMVETAQQPETRTYKAVFTIEETKSADGKVNIMAHSPKLIPSAFLDRMLLRQVQYEDAQAKRGTMHAISVKRQRKLKMKKHKYKKLMKKQRHERLKHGRT